MILQSVPTEDYDEENGLVTGDPRPPPPSRKISSKLRRRITAADHRNPQEDEVSWKLVALGLCCCLGVVATGASLAVLSRLGETAQDLEGAGGSGRPLLAVFGLRLVEPQQALPSDNAVAWLAARLLQDQPLPAAAAAGDFGLPEATPRLLPDGDLVQSWHPKKRRQRLRAVVVGPIADILQAQHDLGPPELRTPKGQTAADAFLHIREMMSEGKSSTDGATEAQLVLVSHPHQLPYLSLMAAAAGFRRVAVLDPALFGAIPWQTFGCSSNGYGLRVDSQAALAQEAVRLDAYVAQLRETEPDRLERLQPLLGAVNATLAFYSCAASQSAESCTRRP